MLSGMQRYETSKQVVYVSSGMRPDSESMECLKCLVNAGEGGDGEGLFGQYGPFKVICTIALLALGLLVLRWGAGVGEGEMRVRSESGAVWNSEFGDLEACSVVGGTRQ